MFRRIIDGTLRVVSGSDWEHLYRVTCADTASHFPSRRAQTSV